ncbi:hypothetical protein, partial [Corallococcus exercitus]|uniref:hypothetical protein n=1 Tax=Corallococcus exercitus TaxID=2316736 RepID=UPI001ABF92A5
TRVMVKSFRHYTGNVFKTFDTPDLASKPDLASYIPGTDLKRLAALWIDTYTNGHEITVSTPRPLNEAFDETDIQALTAGRPPDAMPLKAFTLSNGQIKVMQGADETDLRQHMDTPHIWGFPTTLITRERVRPGYT